MKREHRSKREARQRQAISRRIKSPQAPSSGIPKFLVRLVGLARAKGLSHDAEFRHRHD